MNNLNAIPESWNQEENRLFEESEQHIALNGVSLEAEVDGLFAIGNIDKAMLIAVVDRLLRKFAGELVSSSKTKSWAKPIETMNKNEIRRVWMDNHQQWVGKDGDPGLEVWRRAALGSLDIALCSMTEKEWNDWSAGEIGMAGKNFASEIVFPEHFRWGNGESFPQTAQRIENDELRAAREDAEAEKIRVEKINQAAAEREASEKKAQAARAAAQEQAQARALAANTPARTAGRRA